MRTTSAGRFGRSTCSAAGCTAARAVTTMSASSNSSDFSPMSELFVHSATVLTNPKKLDKYSNYDLNNLPAGVNPTWVQDKQGTWRMYMDPLLMPTATEPSMTTQASSIADAFEAQAALWLEPTTASSTTTAAERAVATAIEASTNTMHTSEVATSNQIGIACVVVLFNYTFIAAFEYAKTFLAKRRAEEMTKEYEGLIAAQKIKRVEKPERVYEPEQYYEFMPQK